MPGYPLNGGKSYIKWPTIGRFPFATAPIDNMLFNDFSINRYAPLKLAPLVKLSPNLVIRILIIIIGEKFIFTDDIVVTSINTMNSEGSLNN